MFKEEADKLLAAEEARKEEDLACNQELLDRMLTDIHLYGEPRIWEQLNSMEIEARLRVLPAFLEAKLILAYLTK